MKSYRCTSQNFSTIYQRFILLIYLLILAQWNNAQSNLNTELIGQWGEGPRNCVAQKDSFLFVNSGTLLEVYVNRDSTMALISKTKTRGFVNDITILNSIAYLAIESIGLSVFNLSDITQPEEIGFLALGGYDPNLLVYQNYIFYATNSSVGLHLIEVSDPANPMLKESFPYSSIRNMAQSGDYLYAANGWYGLKVFDISDIDEITVIYTSDEFYIYDIDIIDNFACVVAGDSTAFMDFTNPSSPLTLSKIALNNMARCKIDTAEQRVFLTGYSAYNIDISDLNDPKILSVANLSSYTKDVTYMENRLTVITEEFGAKVYEIDSLGNLALVDQLSSFGYSMAIAVYHDYVFLANNNNGLNLFDVSDPQNPEHIHSFLNENNVRYLDIRDHYLYCSSNGLKIFDIANPENPVEVAYVELSYRSQGFQIKNNRIYLAADINGVFIIDITDPTNPQIISQLDTPGNTYQVDIHGDTLYLADWNEGLRIIDISDETSPNEIAALDSSWMTPMKSVRVFDNYAWIGSTNFGIRIVDISDLSNPVRLTYLNTARGHDIQVEETRALVSAGYKGFYLFDTTNPVDPEKIGFYDTPGKVNHSCRNEEYYFLADMYCGFSIIRFDDCSAFSMETSSHNSSCFGSCDGSISVDNLIQAQEPITYSWSNGSANPELDDLCAGTYALTITDAQNCIISETFDITEPDELLFEFVSSTDIDENNEYGSIELSVVGGTPDYTYYWEGPNDYASASPNLYFLEEGCYKLTVTDANGCTLISDDICIADHSTGLGIILAPGELICYPNPADDIITLEIVTSDLDYAGTLNASLEIYDLMGKKIWEKANVIKNVNVSGVPEGFYWLKISTKNMQKYLRITIQR